jgi:hypothetical protein
MKILSIYNNHIPTIGLYLFMFICANITAQDTVSITKLEYENDRWCLNQLPFTGVAVREMPDMTDYYTYCGGYACGYIALYPNKDTAAIHTYNGNNIHLVFFTKQGLKTLEYNQCILDETYLCGEWKDFRDDGSLQVKGNYLVISKTHEVRSGTILKYMSVKDRIWEFYDETGKPIKTEHWKKGTLKKTFNN